MPNSIQSCIISNFSTVSEDVNEITHQKHKYINEKPLASISFAHCSENEAVKLLHTNHCKWKVMQT